MSERPGFVMLQDVLLEEEFPALDLALRAGRHIDRDNLAWYQLLSDAQDLLEPFYRRYGCELVYKNDGYFYLLPSGDKLPRRQLKTGDMIVGQALALLYLDPASVERGGVVTREQLVAQLVAVLGEAGLVRTFHARKRRVDERVAHNVVRTRIAEAMRRLAALGFLEMLNDEQLRLRSPLLRFAEPVRGLGSPEDALAKLVARGEVSLTTDESENESEGESEEADAPRDDERVPEEAPSDADRSTPDEPDDARDGDGRDPQDANAEDAR